MSTKTSNFNVFIEFFYWGFIISLLFIDFYKNFQLDNDIEMNIDGLKIITKLRHRLELQDCHLHLKKFLNSNLSVIKLSHIFLLIINQIDVCGEELRSALNALGRIVGRIDVEDVLDVLFQDFCIGK